MDSQRPPPYLVKSAGGVERSTEDDPLVDGPLISPDALHSAIRNEFRAVPTTCSAVLLALVHVVYVVLSLCLAVLCMLKLGNVDECSKVLGGVRGESVIVFGKVGLWVLVLLFSACAHHHHNNARSRGYLRFCRDTRRLKHLPLAVHSAGNVLMLLVLSSRLLTLSDRMEAMYVYMVIAILVVELLVALRCLLVYTGNVYRFNRERAAPDVIGEEPCYSHNEAGSPTETGFREGCGLEEVVEKQADLIEYLKQHNTLLSKRLLNLSAQH